MKHLKTLLTLVSAAVVGCGGSRIFTECPPEPRRSPENAQAAPRPECIDFDHPEASLHPNLVMMVKSRLETDTETDTERCFQVHSFVETGVATNEGFVPLAVLLERHANGVDAWVFDWTNLRLSPVGTLPSDERLHVEVVDAGRRAILVSTNGAQSRRGRVFVPNLHESSVPHDQYVPASECLILQRTGARPWWRGETHIDSETNDLVVDYVGVDAESLHQESLSWNTEEHRYTLPDGWSSREESGRTCSHPEALAPEAGPSAP